MFLEVERVEVHYQRNVRALRSVSIAVGEGEVVAVLGSNGAGKTTLLRALSGTLRLHGGAVTGGDIRFRGESLLGRQPADTVEAGLVQVPEGRRVFERLTVEENLRAGAITRPRSARARALAEVYERLPILRERRQERAGFLSGGQQQLLAIGRALVAEPALLLLDEPSLGLAPRVVGEIGRLIRDINARGTAVLLVEQNAVMALATASRAYVLEVGQVSLEGPADQLSATDEVRRLYLGGGDDPTSAAAAAVPVRQLTRWEG